MKRTYFKINSLKLAFIGLGALQLLTSCGGSGGGIPEETSSDSITETKAFSVEEILEMVAHENDVTRTLYTKGIVGAGKTCFIFKRMLMLLVLAHVFLVIMITHKLQKQIGS